MSSDNYSISELLSMIQNKVKTNNTITRISSSEDIYNTLYEYSIKEQEHFVVILLDGASNIITKQVINVGTLNQCMVHPRDVFRQAIVDNAAGIILCHNHPSGSLEPSEEDKKITTKLQEASKIIGIELLDHIIISKYGYYSFSDENLI